METVKKLIGRLPVYKGDWVAGSYSMLSQVSYLGSTFQSKIDNNTATPATVVNNALQVNSNWNIISNGTAAYLADSRLTVVEDKANKLESGVATKAEQSEVDRLEQGIDAKIATKANQSDVDKLKQRDIFIQRITMPELYRQYANIINDDGEICASKFVGSSIASKRISPTIPIPFVRIRLDASSGERDFSGLLSPIKYITYISDYFTNLPHNNNNMFLYWDKSVTHVFGCNFGSYRNSFAGADNLEYAEIINLRSSISFNSSPKMTQEWVDDFVSKLPTTTEAYTITLNAATKSKLSADQINTIVTKGWTLV